ncbi:MAG: hypothetical protein F4056_10585 [Chloroflexi bacterium]|nr:hypothetical protein [Chloroflexota bacterium]
MLHGRPAGERGEWELRCEGCLIRTVRAAAQPELSGGARAGGENGAQGGTAAAGLAEIVTRLNAVASGLRAAERLLHRRMGPHWHATDEWQGLDALRAEARRLALASKLLADEVRAAGADAASGASAAGRRA